MRVAGVALLLESFVEGYVVLSKRKGKQPTFIGIKPLVTYMTDGWSHAVGTGSV